MARLRELILTLAVQGKLLPQDPKDEPASELLKKKILAEKDRLIADKRIRRSKPMDVIDESECGFALPSNWVWSPTQHYATVRSDEIKLATCS